MAHTFYCEKCGKRFDVDPALIGKRAKCKQCQHVFLIPGAVAGARHPAPPRTAPPVDDPYGLGESAPLPSRPSPYGYSVGDEESLPPRPGRPVASVTRPK